MKRALPILLLLTACAAPPPQQPQTKDVLRVCADPNNLPFSNARREGFENKIADVLARDLNARVEYTWWPQRRGFVRETLKRKQCDVIIGVPTNFELAQTTAPYYRSSYVFVSRADRKLAIESLDDPRLKELSIGVQLIGDDGANAPPVHALAARGLIANMRGYTVYGDYARPNPAADILAAVARREIDLAIVWGPQAGWFAKRQNVPLHITPVSPQIDPPFLPFVFDISMAVRRGEPALREKLESAMDRRRGEIEGILDEYGVPRV